MNHLCMDTWESWAEPPPLFREKYRISSTRLKGWDYGGDGLYVVTICTKDMREWMGEIRDGKMYLSEAGKIVERYWNEIPKHYPGVTLDMHVVMPNHVHGILYVETRPQTSVETPYYGVSTTRNPQHMANWSAGSLGSIIQQFKSICTKCIRDIHPDFSWQPRFYDHVIRQGELERVQRYIRNNPEMWNIDPTAL